MKAKKKVVVIDDDSNILQTVTNLLENHGFEVHARNVAFESTNFIIRHQPDIVLLDVNMPFLSGNRLLEILQKLSMTRTIPVVYFSSNDENTLRKMTRDTGAFGYISKSDIGADFAARVEEMIERAEAQRKIAELKEQLKG